MGKARTAGTSKKKEGEEKPTSTNTGLGRRKQPNVASAGLAFLTASGYFPLPLQTPSTSASSVITIDNKNLSSSSSAPLHEFITSWESRSEACQVMREQNTMTNGVTRKNQQQSKTKTTKSKQQQDQNNTSIKSDDVSENEDSSTSTANNKVQNIGSAKVNWELLLKMRNWLLSVLVDESNRVTVGENTRETVRSLLLGIPLTNPVILDDAVPVAVVDNESTEMSMTKNENEGEWKSEDAAVPVEEDEEANAKPSPRKSHQQQKSNEEIQKKLDFISECDWPTLVGIARKQIEEVMDPFMKKHGVLL